ncbi:hypothetical protein [Granulicella paludicola]|uniref:hypothetical protein n=1 Tax=Granulicella paludicola TaxID=474951 RepID=UPI0021E07F94|nr:hypothetical protein [Granulicella paludicola]
MPAEKQTFYCPQGHNVIDATEPPECASCGSYMTLDDTGFYQVVQRNEDEGIAEAEHAITKPKA